MQILDEKNKAMMMMAPPSAAVAGSSSGGGYGNVPLEVSQTTTGGGESKFNQQGKKFGKKMGNAGTCAFISNRLHCFVGEKWYTDICVCG